MKKMSLTSRLRSRKGLNLIELAIVMAVVGLIVGGIYIAASSVYRNVRESQLQDDVLQIVQNVKSTYGTQGQIAAGAIAATTAVNAGLVPGDMVQGSGAAVALVDSFGGTVTLSGVSATTPEEIAITLNNLPQSVCSDILVKDSAVGVTGAANAGLVSIQGGATTTLASAFPILPATAIASCTAATNTVVLTYTIQ